MAKLSREASRQGVGSFLRGPLGKGRVLAGPLCVLEELPHPVRERLSRAPLSVGTCVEMRRSWKIYHDFQDLGKKQCQLSQQLFMLISC